MMMRCYVLYQERLTQNRELYHECLSCGSDVVNKGDTVCEDNDYNKSLSNTA